jgi:hypothetical protein
METFARDYTLVVTGELSYPGPPEGPLEATRVVFAIQLSVRGGPATADAACIKGFSCQDLHNRVSIDRFRCGTESS